MPSCPVRTGTRAHLSQQPWSKACLGLTREIQLQLKRVGCYQGEINGVWSPSVSRAMKAFTDHVNAALPVEQPDIILLALVQNHRDRAACGRGCPAGQGLVGDGRCLPNAHIASAAEKKTPAGTASIALSQAVFKPSSGRPAAKGRMSLAGPALLPASRGYKEARKGPTTQPRNMEARARKRWQLAATTGAYSRYPTWAARAFLVIP